MECPNCSDSNNVGAGRDGDRRCGGCGHDWNVNDPKPAVAAADPVDPDVTLDAMRLAPDDELASDPAVAEPVTTASVAGLVTPERLDSELAPIRADLALLIGGLSNVQESASRHSNDLIDRVDKNATALTATLEALVGLSDELSALSLRLELLEADSETPASEPV